MPLHLTAPRGAIVNARAAGERQGVRRRRELRNLHDVLTQPVGQLLTVESARRHGEHQAFLVIDRGVNLIAIQYQEDFHRRVANPLVPIDEGVICHEAEA
jgi:hypothetical protein